MVSSDLTCKKDGKRGDLDYLISLGWSVSRMLPGASSVLSLHLAQDTTSLKDALRYTLVIVKQLNGKRGWNLKASEFKPISEKSLRYHVAPACPTCRGRRYKVIDGTPNLSATACNTCHGTGKRPFPLKNGREISEVVWCLEDTNRVIGRAVQKMLR
jgi:hypothetical protein